MEFRKVGTTSKKPSPLNRLKLNSFTHPMYCGYSKAHLIDVSHHQHRFRWMYTMSDRHIYV